MRILLDTCIWSGVLDALFEAGHDVIWTGNWPTDPGDEEILAHAYNENRILITLDKDFGELVFLQRKQHSGIIRLVNFPVKQQSEICVHILNSYQKEIERNAIITVDPKKVRIRMDTNENE